MAVKRAVVGEVKANVPELLPLKGTGLVAKATCDMPSTTSRAKVLEIRTFIFEKVQDTSFKGFRLMSSRFDRT